MTLNTFSIFLTLVEEMNFTRAAQRLFITQQSLSGHIKRLEDEYGVTLFERRPILRLTAEGENMVFYARQILRAQNSMLSDFADLSARRTAYLDIGISYLRSAMFGSGIWRRFHRQYPNIRVRMVEQNTTVLLDLLQRGEISLMVGVDIRPVPGLLVMPALRERVCCVVDRDLYAEYYPREAEETGGKQILGKEITIRQIREIPMMLPARDNRLRVSLDRMYRIAGFMPKVLLESERQDALYRLAGQGEGAAILSPLVLYNQEEEKLSVPENCHVFRILESGVSVVAVAVLEDTRQTHYAEAMMEIVRLEFARYGEAIAQLGLRG
ncbi:MAG: LysR family transcriptional regulator [Eubacteriales bacterium]|nr:LysR family transcriptional regulator [Eubacteriales bacterium]